jgi:hypothetical protein
MAHRDHPSSRRRVLARAAASGRYGVQVLSSSVVASAFVPHLCSFLSPAGSLDAAPSGGKEHLSVLRSQNSLGTGFSTESGLADNESFDRIQNPLLL